jgi:hypothetical protein
MRHRYLLLFIAATIMFSCKKEKQIIDPPSPPPSTALIKDVVLSHLPSPYYHFEYNAAGKVTFVSFASDFTKYDVVYDGDRIKEMRNNIIVNKDTLRYSYDNAGRVDAIKYINEAGTVYTVLFFTYDGQKLIEMERDRKSGTGFIIDKVMTMSYHPDGNLNELTYHYLPFNGQPEQVYTDRFEQYDNKINAEGFSLLHDEFFDHFVFLPQVQLQKNNPGKETRTGNGDNYKVDYAYTYDNRSAPLTRSGDFVYTSGPNTGQRIPLSSIYTYYP